MNRKTLVAFFSISGRTKAVATVLSEVVSGDLYEIIPKEPYSNSDVDWNDKNSRCTKEWKNASIRPEIENPVSDMTQYDVIFVGYPIWYEKAPSIIYTFLESYDFSNKIIVPFSTSGGSIRGSMGKHLHKYCSKQTNWKTGKLFNHSHSKEEMKAWVEKLKL